MKQNLQLRISQNLALTPQLQQSIRLLQLSSLELNQELDGIVKLTLSSFGDILEEKKEARYTENPEDALIEKIDNGDDI